MHYYSKSLYSKSEENQLAERLSDFAANFKDSVIVGSYPVRNNRYYKVRISLECQDPKSLETAQCSLENLLGNGKWRFNKIDILLIAVRNFHYYFFSRTRRL